MQKTAEPIEMPFRLRIRVSLGEGAVLWAGMGRLILMLRDTLP